MRITDCENIRTHLKNDKSNDIVIYDCYLSNDEYDTISFMLTNQNDACKHLYVHVRYAKDANHISDALKTVIEKSNEYSNFTTLNPYYNASYVFIENRLEHEFLNEAMEYIKYFKSHLPVDIDNHQHIPVDIDNYQIDFWKFT